MGKIPNTLISVCNEKIFNRVEQESYLDCESCFGLLYVASLKYTAMVLNINIGTLATFLVYSSITKMSMNILLTSPSTRVFFFVQWNLHGSHT